MYTKKFSDILMFCLCIYYYYLYYHYYFCKACCLMVHIAQCFYLPFCFHYFCYYYYFQLVTAWLPSLPCAITCGLTTNHIVAGILLVGTAPLKKNAWNSQCMVYTVLFCFKKCISHWSWTNLPFYYCSWQYKLLKLYNYRKKKH